VDVMINGFGKFCVKEKKGEICKTDLIFLSHQNIAFHKSYTQE